MSRHFLPLVLFIAAIVSSWTSLLLEAVPTNEETVGPQPLSMSSETLFPLNPRPSRRPLSFVNPDLNKSHRRAAANLMTVSLPAIQKPIVPPRGHVTLPGQGLPTQNAASDPSAPRIEASGHQIQKEHMTFDTTRPTLPCVLDFFTTTWLYNLTHFAAFAYGSAIAPTRPISCQQIRATHLPHEHQSDQRAADSDFPSMLTVIYYFDHVLPLSSSSVLFANEPSDYLAQCQLYRAFSCHLGARTGFIAVHEEQRQIFAVFRGSVNVINYFDNLIFYKVPLDWASTGETASQSTAAPPMVHSGYWKAYLAIQPQFLAALKDLLQSDQRYASYSLLFIGHSLGGVLSIFAALDYAMHQRPKSCQEQGQDTPPVQVVTIGSPRIGDASFAKFYHAQLPGPNTTLRVVMGHDPVPQLLFSPLLGYAHVGREVWIQKNKSGPELASDLGMHPDTHVTYLCDHHAPLLGMEDPHCSASLSSMDLQPLDHLSVWNISIVDYLLKC